MKMILVTFSLSFMLFFVQTDCFFIGDALVNQVKSVVGSFSNLLFTFLSQFEFFAQIFDTSLTPEEAGKVGQMAAQLFYDVVGLPLDEEVAEMSRKGFKRAFSKGLTPEGYAMSFGVLLEDFLTNNNFISAEMLPLQVLKFANMLKDNIFQEDTTYQLQVDYPYFGALMKTLAQYILSLKHLDNEDVRKLAVKFFEEMDKNTNKS